jgi:DNA topoisomerase-1
VNDYLREVTEDDFTAKDSRTWHGTEQMAQELAALGPALTETEAKRNIVEAVKLTARRSGSVGTQLRTEELVVLRLGRSMRRPPG